MGKNCIVILISEQTIQNIMFLKWFLRNKLQTNLDLLYVTTDRMEKRNKIEAIKNALGNAVQYFAGIKPVTVDENDIESVFDGMRKILPDTSIYEKIHVNATGGTKLMSIACYEFFKELSNTVLYYQPIDKPLKIIHPEGEKDIKVEIPVTLKEYFAAYNISFCPNYNCIKDWNYNRNVLPLIERAKAEREFFMKIQNDNHFKKKLKNNGFLDFKDINKERLSKLSNELTAEYLQSISEEFGFGKDRITATQVKYITGGWFEEFVFQKIKKEKQLSEEFIALNVKIRNNTVENEFDVTYIEGKTNPMLHIIECKSFIDEESQSKLLLDTLYKMQALKKDFGLSVKSHLYTMSIIQKKSVFARAESFGIEIVDRTKLVNPEE